MLLPEQSVADELHTPADENGRLDKYRSGSPFEPSEGVTVMVRFEHPGSVVMLRSK